MKTTLSKVLLGIVVCLVLGLSFSITLISTKAYAYEEFKTSPINEYTTSLSPNDLNILHLQDDYGGEVFFDQYAYSVTYTKGGNSLTARLFDMDDFFINYSYNYTNILFGMNYYSGYDFTYPIYDDYFDNLYCLWFLWSYDDDMPSQSNIAFYQELVERSISYNAFTIYDPAFYETPIQLTDSSYFTTYYVGTDPYQINQIFNQYATDESQNYGIGFLSSSDLITHISEEWFDHPLFTAPFIQPLCTPIMVIQDNTTIIGYSEEQLQDAINKEIQDYIQNDGYRVYLEGIDLGRSQGYDEGYQDGKRDGLTEAPNAFREYTNVLTTAWDGARQFLSTPILGNLTILHLILIPLLLGIFLIILKLIRG